jgi:hypothetical protein
MPWTFGVGSAVAACEARVAKRMNVTSCKHPHSNSARLASKVTGPLAEQKEIHSLAAASWHGQTHALEVLAEEENPAHGCDKPQAPTW